MAWFQAPITGLVWAPLDKEPDGTRKSRSCGCGAKAKQDAKKLAAEIHSALLSGSYSGDPSLVLWSAFIGEYKRVEIRKKHGVHANHIKTTIDIFERHMKPRSMSQVTTKFIDEFVVKRSGDRGRKPESRVSPSTVNRDLRNLKLILRVAVEWGQLEKMPQIRMLKVPQRIKRHVTVEHFVAMFAATKDMTEPEIPNATAIDYWRAVISFAYVTGWRINEILNVRRDDVNFETGQVVARWDDSKGKRDEVIFVPASLLEILRPVWQNFAERPLQWNKSRRSIYKSFMALQQFAQINLRCEEAHQHTASCHVYGFHDFRRAFATNNASLLAPGQLQQMMKHSDFGTTQSYINYAKLMAERPEVFVPDVLKTKPESSGTCS